MKEKQPTTYYVRITLRDGLVLQWDGMTKQKANSVYKWSVEHFINAARDFEWGIE